MTISEQILPRRILACLTVIAALSLAGCGFDADEETSTGSAMTSADDGATGSTGPSGPTGPTGESGEEDERQSTGAGLGTEEPEPAG